jgi:hypothetical protein
MTRVPLNAQSVIMGYLTDIEVLFTNETSYSHIMVDKSYRNTGRNTEMGEHAALAQNQINKIVA